MTGVLVNFEVSLPGFTRKSITLRKNLAKTMDARVKPGHDDLEGVAERSAYAASTSTSSESSNALIVSLVSSEIAAPSRALTFTPLTSTRPAAGTR